MHQYMLSLKTPCVSTIYKSLEPVHIKFITKFEILTELGRYLSSVLIHFKEFAEQTGQQNSVASRAKRLPKFAEYWVPAPSNPLNSVEADLRKYIQKVQNIQDHYYDAATPLLSNYYSLVDRQIETSVSVENAKTEEYYLFLSSENLIDQMERVRQELQAVSWNLSSSALFKSFMQRCGGTNRPEFFTFLNQSDNPFSPVPAVLNIPVALLKMSFEETISKYTSRYEENKIDLPSVSQRKSQSCPYCHDLLILFADDSEMRCDHCGFIDVLCGTLFDDNQFYNQQITCTKHKKHNPNLHCAKWLYQIQAKEVKTIPTKAIEIINQRAIKEYTRGGVQRDMCDLKCRQVRLWLKELKLAKLNNHSALLRKIITGLNGQAKSPPQLSNEEEQRILNDFSMAVDIFEMLSKKDEVLRLFNKPVIRNKLYYPFFLLKILIHHLHDDSRLTGLLECIHLQSSITLTKDDQLWKMICHEMTKHGKKYTHEPTNRTMLIDIF
jgi:hypothetical protein